MKLKQFIFALVAMLSCFGFTANAENVAKVGNTEYATIDEAIANWTDGTTLTLLADVTLSDVIKLSSTEYHILDLGTHTMTAKKGSGTLSFLGHKDAIEIVNNGRSKASYALDIKADAINPGGITTASTKTIVKTTGKSGVQDRPIIRFYGGVFNCQNVVNHSGSNGTNCPQFNFYGGVFNGNISANRAKFIFEGGIFNGSLSISVDSSADALVKGGKFKKLSNSYGSTLNSDKFTIGSAAGVYDRGVCVDEEGYYVITSAPIKEVSAEYPAVFKKTYGGDDYFYYSAAQEYGLFYKNVEMAIAKHGEANVTVWEKPAVTIPENVEGAATVVEEIKNNTALKGYTPENLPAGAELEIVLESVEGKFVYDVTPMANGAKVETTEEITFRLPVPASVTTAYAKVYHEGTLMGLYEIKGEGNAKYVEISSANFSEFSVEPVAVVAKIGETAYATLSEAFAAVTNDNQTVVICKDVTENLTDTLRGNITTENGAKVTITLTNSDWVYCPYTFVLGENVTMNVPALFYYAGGAQINGTLVVDAYYQRYANTKLTINEPGSMTVKSETCIIRYMEDDANAGIYVNGDNDPETVGLNLAVAYFYQGMINAKNANIVAGTYWQTNETDGQGSANLVLDNSTLTVTVYDHPAKATGNSTVTLTNESVLNAQNGGFTYGDNAKISVDATSKIIGKDGEVKFPVASVGGVKYYTLEEAFEAATEGQTITLVDDATPVLQSQRAITKAAVIDLGSKTLTLTEDDLYFGTTTFKNGTIVVDPSVKPSTAVFWMFANQTLTFDNVKIVATGVTGTYLIGLEGENSDLNLLNGSEILVENTTALDLDIICVNGTNTCDIKVEDSKVNVTNLDGRVFFRGNYTVKDSEVNLAGITKAGFRIEAGQTLSIEGTSKVTIKGEPRDGGIHLTDLTATYTKEETANVTATVNEPKVAKIGENTYRTLAQAVAAVEDGGTITLIANETFTKNNRYNNGGWWDGLGYSGDKSFTIDLNDFTVSQDGSLNDYLFWFKNVGSKENTITIKNGTLDAGTTAFCALCTASSHENKLTINTENLTLINNKSDGSTVKVRAGSVLNVKAGTKITGKNSYLGIENWKATVNIYDGAEIYMNGTASYNGCLAGVGGGGTINVYGGYGKGVKGGFIAMTSGGTINISGGEWIANTDGTVGNNSNLYVLTAQSNKSESGFAGPSIINVTGGTFRGGMDAWVLNNAPEEKAELNIKGGNFNVNPTSYVADGYVAVENNGVWTVEKAAAKVGEKGYATLEEAFKAATSDCTIDILSDVTVDYNWDARYTGGKFTVPVTINGNGNTIKFTASVNDNNYQAPFRFEADATVKNLTIDMSEVTDNRFRAISSKGNLTVDGCKFIGKDESLNCRAIIFGEGAGTNVGNLAIAITNSEFINWKRGITDNENAQDVKTVTITGNTLTDAGVGVSAKETVTFTGNTVAGAYVNIKSYTAGNKLAVTATGNTLEANTEAAYNVINAGGAVKADEGFNVVAVAKVGETYYATLAEAIAASNPETSFGDEVTLLKDVTLEGGYADADDGLRIEKSVTINGAGYTIDCGIFTKGIRIYQNGDKASNVMFKNINIVNNNYQGRCIDTRSAKINLMLNGGVNLTAHGTNSQPLTIGGSEAMTKVTISGGTIDAGTSGYGVICFVPVTNNIEVHSNAVIKGYAALYLKEGVTKTAIKLSQATIIGTNKYAAASGDFGAIVIEGSNNAVRLEHSDAVVKAVAGDGAEMAAQAAFFLRGNNNTVGYYNNANAQVVTEGGQAYWTLSKAEVTGTKYERNGVEMLLEAETRGYQFITVEDALRYAKNGDTVKLLANAELDETYVNEKSLTLDLNGKTLSTAYVAGSTTNHLYAIQNNAELTITDSSDAKDGKISARGIFNYGAMTLENGTINAIDGNGGYGVRNYAGATFTMNGGTIATTLEDDHQVNNGGYDATTVRVDEGATFIMNVGVINNICDYTFAIENYGTTTVEGGEATSVHTTVANYGTMTINGGEFTCNGIEGITAHALWAAAGETTINGGTFDGKDNYNGFNVDASEGAVVNITGGTFLPVHSGSLYGEGTITVSGGTFFDKIPDQRCELGFQAVVNAEGTYDVTPTGKREAYTIVDGNISKYDNSAEIKLGTFTYKRNLLGLDEDGKYKWSPLYLPVQIPVDSLLENYDVAYINDIHSFDNNEDGEIDKMTIEYIKIKTGTLKANYPYVIRPKNEKARTWNLVLTDVVLYPNKENTIKCSSVFETFTIGGTYHTMTGEELAGKLSIKGNGNWENNEASYTLNPLRLHMSIERDGTPVIVDDTKMSIRIAVRGEDDLTDIDAVRNNNETNTLIFDLQGRRVLKPVKGGIYIINGKKVYFE